MISNDEIEIAWAAGVLEGDGCFSRGRYHSRNPTYKKPTAYYCIVQLGMTDLDTVQRVATIFGGGTVFSLPKRGHWKQMHHWAARAREARAIMRRVYPYMGHRRQARIRELLAVPVRTQKRNQHTWRRGAQLEFPFDADKRRVYPGDRRLLVKEPRVYGRFLARWRPGHPAATKKHKLVHEHRLVAEAALGYVLALHHEVFHVDGDTHNNAPRNLVVCEDHAYYRLLWQRRAAWRACGDPAAIRCSICNRWESNLTTITRRTADAYHRACAVVQKHRRAYKQRLYYDADRLPMSWVG